MDWDDRSEVEMVRDLLLKWAQPKIATSLELMAVPGGPTSPEDIDLLWTAGHCKALCNISFEQMELLFPAILAYFFRLTRIQDFYPATEVKRRKSNLQLQKDGEAVNLLASLLIEKALEWPAFAQMLFWTLKIKSKELKKQNQDNLDNVYARLLGMFLQRMQQSVESKEILEQLFKQEHLFLLIIETFRDASMTKMTRHQRIEYLRQIVGEPDFGILSFTSVALPYDPLVRVTGTLPEKVSIFKSNAMPVKLSFITTDISEHSIIVKTGEDLRQDMFVLGVLKLIDWIWRREGLNLQMTVYRCMALTLTDGILEFVPSQPLSAIISAYYGNLLAFLHPDDPLAEQMAHIGSPSSSDSRRGSLNFGSNSSNVAINSSVTSLNSNNPTITATPSSHPFSHITPESIQPEVLENYLRSCAGYCVFTYVMGIGDRHLENLLLTRDGRVFHVDFSYLFGRDPKPFPPPMKLCKEMVEAMGGPNSSHFRTFKLLCFEAFTLLRKHAKWIIAYLELTGERGGSAFVQDRLVLHLDDVDALVALEKLIDESMHALFPKMFETLHKWAQYWRQ